MQNVLAQQITTDVLNKLTILDVRTPEEFNAGHIDQSQNLPVEDLISGSLPKIPTNNILLVYCESGARSQIARQILDSLGYQTYNLLGGYTAWINKKPS